MDNINNKFTSFMLNGQHIQLKGKLERKDTPNYVDEWAKFNKIDLKTINDPEFFKRKRELEE